MRDSRAVSSLYRTPRTGSVKVHLRKQLIAGVNHIFSECLSFWLMATDPTNQTTSGTPAILTTPTTKANLTTFNHPFTDHPGQFGLAGHHTKFAHKDLESLVEKGCHYLQKNRLEGHLV